MKHPDSHTPLSKLHPVAQAHISQFIGRDDTAYHLLPGRNVVETTNTAQHLTAQISSDGMTVQRANETWTLVLQAVPCAALQLTQSNRVAMTRGTLTEWYVNGPVGLEQGWTLNAPASSILAPSGEAVLRLASSGTLPPHSEPTRTALTLRNGQGEAILRYSGFRAYDAVGRALDAQFEWQGTALAIRANTVDAVYPLTIDPFVQTATLTASDNKVDNQFGAAVSIDGNTIVVGAPDYRSAYVFEQ